jgi:hypothetical protein
MKGEKGLSGPAGPRVSLISLLLFCHFLIVHSKSIINLREKKADRVFLVPLASKVIAVWMVFQVFLDKSDKRVNKDSPGVMDQKEIWDHLVLLAVEISLMDLLDHLGFLVALGNPDQLEMMADLVQ